MSDINTIKSRLSDQADSIMSKHYPNAVLSNGTWMMGDLKGSSGMSCKSFYGKSNGVFMIKDHALGETKDILWFLQNALGLSFRDTLPEARKLCGISTVVPSVIKASKPVPPKGKGRTYKGTPAFDYLNGTRQICEDILTKYKIGYDDFRTESNDHCWTAPFIDSEGDLVYVKKTGINKNAKGKKEIRSTKPWSTLWGWWLVDDDTRKIVITEGEICAMSFAQVSSKYPVLSLPSGVDELGWIEHDWDRLRDIETIYLVMDMDEAGEMGARKISDKLGKTKCRRVSIGHKCNDVNDLLCAGKATETYLEGILNRSKTFDPPSVLSPQNQADMAVVENEQRKESIRVRDFVFPEMDFKLLDGDTGILTGQAGSGKTDLANQIMLNEVQNGQVVCIIAADTPANDICILSAWQVFGHDPNQQEIRAICEALDGRVYFIDAVNHRMGGDEMIETMSYVVQRYGVTRFLIDNLFEVDDIAKDDYNKQDKFVRKLDKFDKEHRTNTMLVAHALMGEDHATTKPDLRGIEGSKGMIKPVQYVIGQFRNRVKENPEQFTEGQRTSEKVKKLIEGHDAYFIVSKCRNGFRKEFTAGLDFDPNSRRFKYGMFNRFRSPLNITLDQSEMPDQGTVNKVQYI